MQHLIIPPREPAHEPVRPPMVYVEKKFKWEYKQIMRDLERENPIDETELNAHGEEGWEMMGIIQHPPMVYYIFKRQTEE